MNGKNFVLAGMLEMVLVFLASGNVFAAMPPSETPGWYAGDQHVHSVHSSNWIGAGYQDFPFLDPDCSIHNKYCIPSIHNMSNRARQNNLSWVIFTEHGFANWTLTGGHQYHSSEEWWQGFNECNAEDNSTNFQCMYGQELVACLPGFTSCTSAEKNGLSEFLAYGVSSYIQNNCTCDCANHQTVIDRVNNATGFGFLAHPHDGSKPWRNWTVTGFTGLEIWNGPWQDDQDGLTVNNHDGIIDSWVEFLLNETTPEDGFIVGIGNSDAHNLTAVGQTFTYCRMDELTESNILEALKKGRCVVSNGPLINFTIKGAEIGDVVDVPSGENISLTFEWKSTDALKITIIRGNISAHEEENITIRTPDNYAGTETLNINQTKDCYYRLEGFTDNEGRVYTNPIWVNVVNCNCSSCDECEEKLNNPVCSVVKLNKSISGYSGTCINNPVNFTNKTFDCQGHTIDGDGLGTWQNPTYGIYLNNKQNNTIKNCIITDF